MASAAIMAVLGLLLCCFRFQLLAQLEREALAIVPGTPMFPNWKDLPVPVITSVYFFNVTNAEDIRQRGAKPHLVEVSKLGYQKDEEGSGPRVLRARPHGPDLAGQNCCLKTFYRRSGLMPTRRCTTRP